MIKICVVCGKEFNCPPSRNIVTCGPECRVEYVRIKHTGLKHTPETRRKMSQSRMANEHYKEIQAAGTRAAQNSPKSGRFPTNVNAKLWHLVAPDGTHYRFRSLRNWLREYGKQFFGVDPDTKQFDNVVSGLSRAKRSVLGSLPANQRPGYTYKGWSVIPTDSDKTPEA